jgi:uncharacterized Tic20 family protein
MSEEKSSVRRFLGRWMLGIGAEARELVRPGQNAETSTLAVDRLAKPDRDLDRLWAAAGHLAFFFGFPIIVPLVVYLLFRRGSAFVRWHSFQALVLGLWTICATVLSSIVLGVGVLLLVLFKEIGLEKVGKVALLIGALPVMFVLGYAVLASAIGGIKSLAGVPWTMPIIGRIASGLIARRSATPELPNGNG